ncbi:hypothetical protein Vafri_2063 [Volvox africanus]|nr:hypothetical protein Vafri_2063 [Volvox africanus]
MQTYTGTGISLPPVGMAITCYSAAGIGQGPSKLAAGFDMFIAFVNDFVTAEVADVLGKGGVKLTALRWVRCWKRFLRLSFFCTVKSQKGANTRSNTRSAPKVHRPVPPAHLARQTILSSTRRY